MTIAMSQIDAAFLRMETPRTPMHVAGLLEFRLPRGASRNYMQELHAHARSQAQAAPPFNYRLANGRLDALSPAWEIDEAFNIDYHLRHAALPHPGDGRALGEYVAREHARPLDLGHPLWELHLIEGLSGRRFAVYFKVHHALMDGMAALRHITNWLSPDKGFDNAPGPWSASLHHARPARPHEPAPGLTDIWQRSIELIKDQLNSATDLTRTLVRLGRREDNPEGGILSALEAPHTRFNEAVNRERRFSVKVLPLHKVRDLAAATGTTINDLAMTLVAGALRRYLQEMNALPDKPLVASIPVGLPHPEGHDGNIVTGFVCPLATQEADHGKRLQLIHTVTKRTKDELRTLPATALRQLALLGLSPMIIGQMTGLATRMPPFFNLVISNVPGPKHKLYLRGAELMGMYPISILLDGHALNVTMVSYMDQLSFGFTACARTVPHSQRLAVYTEEVFAELLQATLSATPTKRRRQHAHAGA